MTLFEVIVATSIWIVITAVVYRHSGWNNIKECYALWFKKSYWTNYNIVEAISWVTKAIIIVPGLIFGIQIWQLYFIALITSASLMWASNKKHLPTLVGFNTLWIWLSLMVLTPNFLR